MAGLTIREFTISTKVNEDRSSRVTENQSESKNTDYFKSGSDYSYRQIQINNMSTHEKENIVQLCVDRVLEIIDHQLER